MQNKIYIDFETRSSADIKKVGACLYAEHPSTDILYVAHSGLETIRGLKSDFFPLSSKYDHFLCDAAGDSKYIFVAHNAFFDRHIWNNIMVHKYGYPKIPLHRWRCTMAKAYAHGLPGNLADCAKTLKLPISKDMEGRESMLTLSKPRKNGQFWTPEEKPEDFEKLYSYCKTDIEVMRLIDLELRDLSEKEQKIWFIDQRINDNGITIDRPAVLNSIELAREHQHRIKNEFNQATNGALSNPKQRAKLLAWLKSENIILPNSQKPTIKKALKDDEYLSTNIIKALQNVQESTRTSLAKYRQMLQRSDDGGNVRELLQYHAAHTGRWGGRGVQIQNLPRITKTENAAMDSIKSLDYESFAFLYPNVSEKLSECIRGMIIAQPGKKLFMGDFSQMEARVLAWLAEQQNVLDAFAAGEDLYCMEASNIYGYKVTGKDTEQRQIGKVAVLALGYGGGIGAFATMAKGYGVNLAAVFQSLWSMASSDEKSAAQSSYEFYLKKKPLEPVGKEVAYVSDIIKQRWRKANPKIVDFWSIIEQNAIRAVQSSYASETGKLTFFMHGIFLFCKLPSGRFMAYPYPRVEDGKLSYLSARHGRESTYGGKLAENITQAVQRDLLAEAMLDLEPFYQVAFHIHDELICEVKESATIENFKTAMECIPSWAKGLPIAVDAHEGVRYGK